jgi:phosphatidate cytidylyltransferase
VAEEHPTETTAAAGTGASQPRNLFLRVVSAVVLAPLAVAIAFVDGWVFAIFWALAATGVAYEWSRMVSARRDITEPALAAVAFAGAAIALMLAAPVFAVAIVLAGAVLIAVLATPGRKGWAAAGIIYAGIVVVAPTVLRQDPRLGFIAIVFLFAVVWATDIFGYFSGRLFGGPKLWRRISPKKTWAGAIGGTLGAVLAGWLVALAADLADPFAAAALAVLLSAVSQTGDLFESAVKRRFGVKDASQIIPGHGGIMDRLDGFLAAALLAAIIGVVRGGFDAPARGLLVW